jgi:DNA (cytosine-5)-methyltransferase 1
MMDTLKVGSLFSGVGGLELGLERAGMEVAFQAEYDKQARRVLARHWPDVHRYEDVHDVGRIPLDKSAFLGGGASRPSAGVEGGNGIGDLEHRSDSMDTRNGEGYGPVDVICGGFPCQDYSVAGKRGGLAGDRGALWWEMHRIIAEYRPTWVIGENVAGILSANGGRDFRTIIHSLVQIGYGVCWTLLDSQYFGVAQRRRRLFIVAHSGGVPRPEVLALSEGLFGHPAPSREAGETDSSRVVPSLNASSTTPGDGTGNIQVAHTPAIAFNWQNGGGYGDANDGLGISDEHSPPLSRSQTPAVASVLTGSPARTRTAETGQRNNGTEQNYVQAKQGPRRLTPVECERLQGFPDGWTEFYADGSRVADGPRYRMMGNAVTVNVAEWIGRRIMQAEKQDRARIGFDASQDSQENGADPGSTPGASM